MKTAKQQDDGKSKKGYKIIANNIDMIPEDRRVAYCKSCSTRPHEKLPIVASESKLIRMLGRKSYGVLGPCSGCGRMRCCFVKNPFPSEKKKTETR
jgi:hypothetical protein